MMGVDPRGILRRPAVAAGARCATQTATRCRSSPPTATRCRRSASCGAAVGCDSCNGTGYRGRTGVYEVLAVNEEIRRLAIRNASGAEIKHAAIEQGLRTLRDDGAHKVLSGLSTIEEVMRVTAEEA